MKNAANPTPPPPPPKRSITLCSFCGKSTAEVKLIIAGPSVFICNSCVEVCAKLVIEKGHELKLPGYNSPIDVTALGVRPRFKKVTFSLRPKHVFFACPFKEPFDSIYADHIKPVCVKLGLSIERADEIYSDQPIIEDIWEAVNSCHVMLADVTGRNPNVMYEIGMAHTVGKPVIIMSQSTDDIPFDLKHYRCILYSYTPRGGKALEVTLENTFRFLVRD
jgi:hypothetical protein